MTIPRSRTFNNKKGFQAQADVGINSPQQSNNQSVNVIVRGIPFEKQNFANTCEKQPPSTQGSTSNLTNDNCFDAVLNQSKYEHKELDIKERNIDAEVLSTKPLNDPVEDIIKERDIESAKNSLSELEEIVKNKDNLIEALSLILDIYENNPLIINKLIVAQEEELTRLLFLLTGAEQIEMIKTEPDLGCTCKFDKFTHIQKIMVKKNGETYNFKYSFPNCVQLLENRKINWKVVC